MCNRALSARIHKAYEIKVQSDTPKRACDEEKTHHKTVCLISCIQCQIEGTEKMNTHKSKGSPRGVPEKINILPVYDTKHNPEPRKNAVNTPLNILPLKAYRKKSIITLRCPPNRAK